MTTGQPAAAVRDWAEGGGLHSPDVPGPTRRHSCRYACIPGTSTVHVSPVFQSYLSCRSRSGFDHKISAM
jgi:hypothetical protein